MQSLVGDVEPRMWAVSQKSNLHEPAIYIIILKESPRDKARNLIYRD
jgi:hypothetical protein